MRFSLPRLHSVRVSQSLTAEEKMLVAREDSILINLSATQNGLRYYTGVIILRTVAVCVL